jgi:hypothetical protein
MMRDPVLGAGAPIGGGPIGVGLVAVALVAVALPCRSAHAQASSPGSTPPAQRCSESSSPPEAPNGEGAVASAEESRFAAYLAALEAYDRSIPSLHWRQSVRIEPAEGPPIDLWKGEVAVLDDGRWMVRGEHFSETGEDGKQEAVKSRYLYDGTRLASYNISARRGLLRGEERSDPLSTSLTPLMLIGRTLDFGAAGSQCTRLPDLLKRLVDRNVDDSALPLVVLSGSVKLSGKWFRLSVTLDTSRGAMPVKLLREDEAYGVVKEEIRVTNALEVQGVWIPLTGWRELCALQPASEEVVRALQDPEVAKKAQGLNLDQRQDRLAGQRLVRDVAGPEPFQRVPLGGGRHVIRVSDPVVVDTDAQRIALLALPFEEGAQVLDVGTGKMLRFTEGRLTPTEPVGQR